MKREWIEGIRFFIGSGSDDFSMSHGSFKYKRKLSRKRELKRESEGLYSDPGTGRRYHLKSEENEGILHLTLLPEKESESLDPAEPKSALRFYVMLPALEGEHIYGCGETYVKLDLKGELVRIFVAEHQNAGRIGKKLIREKLTGVHPTLVSKFKTYESYYAQPTFISSDRYFVHVNAKRYSEFDFRKGDSTMLCLEEYPDLYIGEGTSFERISGMISDLLGHQDLLPDWIYDGAILAVQEGTDKINEKIERARAAGVKVCGIWSQDWSGCRRTGFGYQVMWNWHVDDELYPRLKENIEKWAKDGIRFLGYINPFLAIEKDVYEEAAKKGYCVKDKEGKDYLVTITTFPAAMIDFTNPCAYEWYKNLIKRNMIGLGMSGWMADFGEYLPLDAVLFDGSDPMDMHNRWPAIWAKMNREAIEECGVEEEVFFFTRAGHTETIQNSTMMWTGDQHVDWSMDDGLPSVIPAILSLAMSGYGISHSDAGGYTTVMHMKRSKELLERWEEMNAFSPLFRTHEGNQPVNNVQFDDDAELLEELALTSGWHAALKPYLKELVEENMDKGIPVMRPIFYHYDEEEAYREKTEYLLGRDLLVAPIYVKGASSRDVYLPEDSWLDLWTGESVSAGHITAEAPIGKIPVYVRDNARGREVRKAILSSRK